MGRMLRLMAKPTASMLLLCSLMVLSQEQEEQNEPLFPIIRCAKGSQAMASFCYALYTTPKSWYEAEVACQKWPSGHLVSVHNGAEAFYVSTLVKSSVQHYKHIWIGIHDPSMGHELGDNQWKWSSNEEVNYFNWEQTSSVHDHGYCGTLTEQSEYLKWMKFHCEIELPYVCQLRDGVGPCSTCLTI